MAKAPKVTLDDFSFEEEKESQPLQIIAKEIQKKEETNPIQPPSSECHSTSFNVIQPPSSECHSTSFNVIQPHSECHSTAPSLTELKVLSFLRSIEEKRCLIRVAKIEISHACQITIKGAETAIRRLRQKGLLEKVGYSSGRYNGYTEYRLNEQSKDVLSLISFNLIQPPSQPPSKKVSKNNRLTYYIPENIKEIGLNESMIRTARPDIQDVLEHLSYSLKHKEFKTNNPLATIRSILNEDKSWVSGKHLQEQGLIIEENKKRLEELKRGRLENLKLKFEIYKQENPEFIQRVAAQSKFIKNPEMIEKIAFEKFAEERSGCLNQ